MLFDRLRSRSSDESGFTLIELLVVVLIIGILAAIAIPSFLSQREKGQDADAKSVARSAQTAIETYQTQEGDYQATVAELEGIEETLTNGDFTVTPGDDTYTVTATSESGNTFSIEREAGGGLVFDCATAGDGGCPSDGTWGKDTAPAVP